MPQAPEDWCCLLLRAQSPFPLPLFSGDKSPADSFFITSSTGCPLPLFRNLFDFLPAGRHPAGRHPAFGALFLELPPDCTLFCPLLDLGPCRAWSPELASRAFVDTCCCAGQAAFPSWSALFHPFVVLVASPPQPHDLPATSWRRAQLTFHVRPCPTIWDADFPVIHFSLSSTHHLCSPA